MGQVTSPSTNVTLSVTQRAQDAAAKELAEGFPFLLRNLPTASMGVRASDAAVRVVLEHLRDAITPIWDGDEEVDDAVSGRHIRKLLEELR